MEPAELSNRGAWLAIQKGKRNSPSIRSRYQIPETFTAWPRAIKQTRRDKLYSIKQLSISYDSSPDACFPYRRYPGTTRLYIQMSWYKNITTESRARGKATLESSCASLLLHDETESHADGKSGIPDVLSLQASAKSASFRTPSGLEAH